MGSFFSLIGVPAFAVALASGLVYGADYFEKNYLTQEQKAALANFLRNGDVKHFGKSVIDLPLHIFDSIFGKRPVSWKFIIRSIIVTISFWIILAFFTHSLSNFFASFVGYMRYFAYTLPLWFFLDWLCLTKSRQIFLRAVSEGNIVWSVALFFVLDIISSIALVFLFGTIFYYITKFDQALPSLIDILQFRVLAIFWNRSGGISIYDVIVPSTMLNTMWTLFMFVSVIIARLLIPADFVRARMGALKVDERPLNLMAIVGAALIILIGLLTTFIHHLLN